MKYICKLIIQGLSLLAYIINTLSFSSHCHSRKHSSSAMSRIREVWVPNLEAEMRNIRDMIDQYPYVAIVRHIVCYFFQMDTHDVN